MRLRPRVEVELIDIALRLVAEGVGDTYLPSAYTRAPSYPGVSRPRRSSPRSTTPSPSSPASGARLSPGVRALLAALETHMLAVADEFDRSR